MSRPQSDDDRERPKRSSASGRGPVKIRPGAKWGADVKGVVADHRQKRSMAGVRNSQGLESSPHLETEG